MEKDNLGFRLAQVYRAHRSIVRRRFSTLGVQRGQPPLIMILYKQDGLTQTELVDKLCVTPATISNMVKRLERSGFVTRKGDPADERISRVYLTEAGRAMQKKMRENINEIEEHTFQGFTTEEKATLHSFFARIMDNLKDIEKPH